MTPDDDVLTVVPGRQLRFSYRISSSLWGVLFLNVFVEMEKIYDPCRSPSSGTDTDWLVFACLNFHLKFCPTFTTKKKL